MCEDGKSGENPGRIIYFGAVEDDQQHFPEGVPNLQTLIPVG